MWIIACVIVIDDATDLIFIIFKICSTKINFFSFFHLQIWPELFEKKLFIVKIIKKIKDKNEKRNCFDFEEWNESNLLRLFELKRYVSSFFALLPWNVLNEINVPKQLIDLELAEIMVETLWTSPSCCWCKYISISESFNALRVDSAANYKNLCKTFFKKEKRHFELIKCSKLLIF